MAASSTRYSIFYNMIIEINLFSYLVNSFDREYICGCLSYNTENVASYMEFFS